MTIDPDIQVLRPSRAAIGRSMVPVLACMVVAGKTAAAPPLDEVLLDVVSTGARVVVAWHVEPDPGGEPPPAGLVDSWLEYACGTIDQTIAPIESTRARASRIVSRLVEGPHPRLHVCGESSGDWIHIAGWEDPKAIERGMLQLGVQVMGGGRYRLPVEGIQIMVRGGWLVVGPERSAWVEPILDRLPPGGPPDRNPMNARSDLIRITLRHDAPVDGITRMKIRPASWEEAVVEVEGDYLASPLPIRPAGSMSSGAMDRLAERFSFVAHESGVGLLDPRMIEYASRFPEVLPSPSLRRVFASERLVVFDGAAMEVPGIGILEVPAIAVAVPLRPVPEDGVGSMTHERIESQVDDWFRTGGFAVRSSWDPGFEDGMSITRSGGIRHLSLGPGFMEAASGHPMALPGQLAWTVRRDSSGGRGWLVAGSSVGLVAGVADRLGRAAEPEGDEADRHSISMHASMVPDRLASQIRDLSRLRETDDDPQAGRDVDLLSRLALILSGLDRLEWISTVQDDDRIVARIRVRRDEP